MQIGTLLSKTKECKEEKREGEAADQSMVVTFSVVARMKAIMFSRKVRTPATGLLTGLWERFAPVSISWCTKTSSRSS